MWPVEEMEAVRSVVRGKKRRVLLLQHEQRNRVRCTRVAVHRDVASVKTVLENKSAHCTSRDEGQKM